jgi:hypothetical protein
MPEEVFNAMVFEGLNQENRPIYIQDLALDAQPQTPELKFNPDTEITESDWGYLEEDLKDISKAGVFNESYITTIMEMYVLSPDRVVKRMKELGFWEKLPSILSDLQEGEAKRFLRELEVQVAVQNYLRLCIARRTLFGEDVTHTKFDDQAFSAAQRVFRKQSSKNNFMESHETITLTAMAFPEKRGSLKIDNTLKEQMLKWMKFGFPNAAGFWMNTFARASHIAVLFPEANVKQYFSDKDWDDTKKHLDINRMNLGHTNFEFLTLSSAMKIVAAEEVKLSDKGLEINMRKAQTGIADHEKMPEGRQF